MDAPALAALPFFLVVYALIVDERVHRSLAAVAGGVVAVASGLVPWDRVPDYLDLNTLLLLAGMMVIVALARDSGLFDWLAIRTARAAGGRPRAIRWPRPMATVPAEACENVYPAQPRPRGRPNPAEFINRVTTRSEKMTRQGTAPSRRSRRSLTAWRRGSGRD